MLICSNCGKIIANTNPNIHYGLCGSCPLPDIGDGEPTTADEHNKKWLEENNETKEK
jgi:hypothetical protein